jgi:hypothetical protein
METQVELEVPLGFGIMYNILQKGDNDASRLCNCAIKGNKS